MKLFTLLTVCLFAFSANSADAANAAPQTHTASSKIEWLTDIEAAKSMAKKQSLPIFLYFSGSDWCPHCKKMDREVLAKPEFQDAMQDKCIFVHVDFPKHSALDAATKKQNSALKSQFGISGFPTVILVDANLKFIAKPARKPQPNAFADEVQRHLKK